MAWPLHRQTHNNTQPVITERKRKKERERERERESMKKEVGRQGRRI